MSQPPEWRQFEKFVARVEGLLAPKGAIVKSPDHIPTVNSGQLRQVDASIRFVIGSTPILITIECRKRRDVQDQTWIEQLVTKKESIGAAKTIAVSSTGLSSPAIELANLKGIETRTLSELPDAIIGQWITGLQFGIYRTFWKLLRLTCEFYKNDLSAEQLKDAFRCLMGPRPAEQPVFATLYREECSANDLVTELVCVKGIDENGFDVPRDEQVHKRVAVARYAPGSLALRYGDQRVPIAKISFDLDMVIGLVGSSSEGRFGEYKNNGETVCYTADYSAAIHGVDGIECTLSFQKDLGTQATTIGFSVLDENEGRLWTTGRTAFPPPGATGDLT